MAISQIVTNSIANGAVTAADLAAGAARANFGAGAVLQVVNGLSGGSTTTSSTSFVSTSLNASITPTSSSSRVIALVSTTTWIQSNVSEYAILTLYRNGTNLGSGSLSALTINSGAYNATYDTTCTFAYVDSPASTSSLTYTLYLKSYAGNGVSVNDTTSTNSIILMEIAG